MIFAKYNSFNYAIKAIVSLNELKNHITYKIGTLDNEIDSNVIESLKFINYNIDLLKVIISQKYDLTCESFEKIIDFEKVVKEILKPETYDEAKAIKLVMDNVKLLHYHDHRHRTFTDLICNYIDYAKIKNNDEQYNYYKNIIKYILNIRNIGVNKKRIYQALNSSIIDVYDSDALNNKINNMNFNIETGRYEIDDFIISIDSNNTIKIDDALSIESTANKTYILGIHITDIYSLRNFNDIYCCNSLLLENINKAQGSLRASAKRNTISLFVEISELGEILNYRIVPSILTVDRNLSYTDVSKIMYSSENTTKIQKTLADLTSLYSVLENKNLPQFISLSNVASVLVTKFMLLNGCIYSEYFNKNNIPGIYVAGDGENNIYTLEKSKYYTGFPEFNSYSKTTSPIYDKSSLLCQYVLHQCAFRNVPNAYKDIIRYRLRPLVEDLNKK